jgi:hypothetical protein
MLGGGKVIDVAEREFDARIGSNERAEYYIAHDT